MRVEVRVEERVEGRGSRVEVGSQCLDSTFRVSSPGGLPSRGKRAGGCAAGGGRERARTSPGRAVQSAKFMYPAMCPW